MNFPSVIPGLIGGAQMPFVESYPFASTDLAAGSFISANRAYFHRARVERPVPVTKARWWVGAAAGDLDAGVYTWDGTTATRLISTGAVNAAGSSVNQDANLSAPFVFYPGVDYWLALLGTNSATLTIARCSSALFELASPDTTVARLVKSSAGNSLAQTYTGLAQSNFTAWVKFL